jgi:hypothetical protein
MLKRKISDYFKGERKKLRVSKKCNVVFPLEILYIIFDVSSFEVKMKFGMMMNRVFYDYYQKFIRELDSKKYVFYTLNYGGGPLFYEFKDVFVGKKKKKYVRFSIDKEIIRRQLKFRNGTPYCVEPTRTRSFKIYMIDQKEKDYIGKSCCDRCKDFTFCVSRKFWWLDICYLENCSIKEQECQRVIGDRLINTSYYEIHDHNLCNKCTMN